MFYSFFWVNPWRHTIQTSGNNPKETIQRSQRGES